MTLSESGTIRRMETREQPFDARSIQVLAGDHVLEGDLVVPPEAQGLVLFAHGSGSGRRSSRNRYVAGRLQGVGLATLLIDLLTLKEEKIDARTRHLRFDIPLLSRRLMGAAAWVDENEDTHHLPVGLFGASTGAAAALIAAAKQPDLVHAVVSRGGRPDLAGKSLRDVRAPTLLLVGSRDEPIIAMNRQAMASMHTKTELVIVPGASHLFEEPGTLEEVSRLAATWFNAHLASFGQHSDAMN